MRRIGYLTFSFQCWLCAIGCLEWGSRLILDKSQNYQDPFYLCA